MQFVVRYKWQRRKEIEFVTRNVILQTWTCACQCDTTTLSTLYQLRLWKCLYAVSLWPCKAVEEQVIGGILTVVTWLIRILLSIQIVKCAMCICWEIRVKSLSFVMQRRRWQLSTTVDRMVYSFLVSTTPLECKIVVAIRSKTKKRGSALQ